MKLRTQKTLLFPILSILAGLLIGTVIILISGENPLKVYYHMLFQPFTSVVNILNIFYVMTPLMIVGLAFIVANSAGMINIGLEGQLLLGSFTAAYVGTLLPSTPRFIYVFLIMICSAAVAAAWAFIPGILKLKFGASDIVTCIMLNYVAQLFINYIISSGIFKHPTIDQRTPYILTNAHIKNLSEIGREHGTNIFRGVQLNCMFIVGLALAILVHIMITKTKWGYKMRAVGLNPNATTANRLNTKKIMLLSMCLSGAIAGIAAIGEILGTFNGYIEGFSPGYGFSGISVALLGRNNPFGVVLAALFFSVLNQGMIYVGANTAIPKDFVKVLQTLIIVFMILNIYFEEKWESVIAKKKTAKEA